MWAERVYGSGIYKNVKIKGLSVERGEFRPGRLDTRVASGCSQTTRGHCCFPLALPYCVRRSLRLLLRSGRPSRRALRVNLAITTEVRIPQRATLVKGGFRAIVFGEAPV